VVLLAAHRRRGLEQPAGGGARHDLFNPAVAQSGNSAVIAASGTDGLDFYWQPIGGSGWNHQQVAGSLTTGSPPSIAQFPNSTVITSLGPNSSVDFYWQPIGCSGWNHQQVAPPGIGFNISSIAQSGTSSVIVADGPNVGQRFYWQPIGGSGWHCQVVPSGSC
jgi:hypothetical protein